MLSIVYTTCIKCSKLSGIGESLNEKIFLELKENQKVIGYLYVGTKTKKDS